MSKRATRAIASESPTIWFARTPAVRAIAASPATGLLGSRVVDADRVEHRLDRAARRVRYAHLDQRVVHRRREPEPGIDVAVVASPMPALGLDRAVRPLDRLGRLALDDIVDDAARRDEVERLSVFGGRREIRLPHQRH